MQAMKYTGPCVQTNVITCGIDTLGNVNSDNVTIERRQCVVDIV